MEENLVGVREYPVSWAIFSLARSHRTLAGGLLGDLGLFPGQELILMQLWAEDGQSQKALGRTQRLDHSTIAKSLRRLETAGLITRRKSTVDGRVTLVFLTDEGRGLQGRTMAAWQELERQSTAGLTAEERRQFVSLARKIAPNLP